ncbi:MAG: methyl-accepting chemotaxis protein [Gammaproteobacteria bacterium]|nr:MAG: methyl-accepting chemotaxis protein [Gammaproteobacteria bacterium]
MAEKKKSTRSGVIWLALGAVSLVAMVANVGYIIVKGGHDEVYAAQASDMRINMQQIGSSGLAALKGNARAFDEVDFARKRFDRAIGVLKNGAEGVPALDGDLGKDLRAMDAKWKEVAESVDTIVSARERILRMHEMAGILNESVPLIQQEYTKIVDILVDIKAPAEQVAVTQKQTWLAERMSHNVDRLLTGEEVARGVADRLQQDAATFMLIHQSLLNGNPAMGIARIRDREAVAGLEKINELFSVLGQAVGIFDEDPGVEQRLVVATEAMMKTAPDIIEQAAKINEGIVALEDSRPLGTETALLAFVAMIFSLFMLGFSSYRSSRVAQKAEEEKRKRQEDSIMQLLNELGDLADGDLTTTATVSEEITGAIADSINYTIDQLRVLVSAINDTAVAVSNASEETRATALHLAEASEHQAQEIAGASAAVNEMAVTIDQVSANAQECTQVAERSVEIAKSGAGVVQNTIKGMDTIREQIQDTSKRIKRLGESSQEIGDIVSLINDIADQTNILALNAAIQASMAGDAGRGFAVVADEVQRLAERSSAATKQIEALVKTIQSDTNEAVISMEQTTAEVVRGARLAEDAGVALEEIESVSTNLAELIQNISSAARQQAASAAHISNTMNVIQEITSQTSAGTTATAQSIGNLAELANTLRESVAGFKLPDEHGEESYDYSEATSADLDVAEADGMPSGA